MERRGCFTLGLLCVLAIGCDAEEPEHRMLDDHWDARPSTLPAMGAPSPGTITPVIFVPTDHGLSDAEIGSIESALDDVEAWYDAQLGDMHLRFGATQIVRGTHDSRWYLAEDRIWSHGPDELRNALGFSPWEDGHVVLLMGRGMLGWAGGAGNANAGYAVVGLESLVDNAACSPEWWCNPDMWRGTTIHELGHALTLPHSEPPSIMDFHGDWRNKVLLDEEIDTVRSLRFAEQDWVDPGPDTGDGDACGGLDYAGRCDGGTLVWCEGGGLRTYDCGAVGMTCGWQDDTIGNNCLAGQSACGDVDYYGRCDDATLVWCEGGSLRSYDCGGVGMRCGWQDDAIGNNCL